MGYISVSQIVDVEADVDYKDLDVDDLAEALISKPNWREALNEALTGQEAENSESGVDDIKELIENFRRGLDIVPNLRKIADDRYGLVC